MTAIFDVVVDNAELTVLGPPSQIDLAVDIGQQGVRGTKVFTSQGDPNNTTPLPVSSPLEGDLCVNTTAGGGIGWLYRYDGSTWNSLLRLQPTIYSINTNVSCSAGVGTVSIPLANILPAESLATPPSANNFMVALTPVNSNPLIFSIVTSSKAIVSTNFEFQVTARVYNPSATGYSDLLSAVTGILNFDLRITVV